MTWDWLGPLLSQVGITRVADITRLDDSGLHVHQAVRPASRNVAVSQGKGISAAASRVSATMESLEAFHAERIDTPTEEATVAEMAAETGWSAALLPLPPGSVLHDGTRLRWLPARSLLHDHSSWMPREFVDLDRRLRLGLQPPLLWATSNGLAGGNTLTEAILHALYEVVERDLVARMPAAPSRWRFIDLATLDGETALLVERLNRVSNHVQLVDLSGGGEIACIQAEVWSPLLPIRFRGFGCHRARDVAGCRAITEAVQARLGSIMGTRDDVEEDLWLLFQATRETEWRRRPEVVTVAWPELPDGAATTLDGDLAALLAAITTAGGRDVLVVELTRPDLGVPMVKVVVPGAGMIPLE